MNIVSVKEQFKAWKSEANKTFGKVKDDMDSLIEPIQRNLKMNTTLNIPQDFGMFLYACLGERVTGQRSSVINADFIASDKGKQIVEKAKEKKCTIEEYLEKYDYKKTWDDKKVFNQTQAFITAGRRFGVSYVTSGGDRSHTIFFEDGTIFAHLTQQHCDCVLNKVKKECTQKFLDYRNSFVSELKSFNKNNLIEIDVPVKVAKLGKLATTGLFQVDRYGNREDNLSAVVIEDIYDDVIKLVSFSTPEIDVWDRVSDVNSSHARHTTDAVFPCLTIQFGSVTGTSTRNAKAKATKAFCNVDISSNTFNHSINAVGNQSSTPIMAVEETTNLPCFNDVVNDSKNNNDRYYNRGDAGITDGLVLNMTDLINHPAVQKELQKRVDFFTNKSKELQELKHSYAGLYFLNGD